MAASLQTSLVVLAMSIRWGVTSVVLTIVRVVHAGLAVVWWLIAVLVVSLSVRMGAFLGRFRNRS